MQLKHLDEITRRHMRDEVENDIRDERLYLSPRLSSIGLADYEELLLEAMDTGTVESLVVALRSPGRLLEMETAVRNGKEFEKRVPVTAADTLGEGEFNRFYARGLCARAISEGISAVRVYRAKSVDKPRSSSTELLGRTFDPAALLADLRESIGMDTGLGLPPGPNSGLSIELV